MLALVDGRRTPNEAPHDITLYALRRIKEILLLLVYKLSTAELYQKAARIAPGNVTACQPGLTLSRRRVSPENPYSDSAGIVDPVATFHRREAAAGLFMSIGSIKRILLAVMVILNYKGWGLL
jgi:hypothetical protein